MPPGGSLPQKNDVVAILNSLLLSQRQANQSKSPRSSGSYPTKHVDAIRRNIGS